MRKKYDETETQAAFRYITECRQAAALFPELRRVFLSFDGKIYNIRLEKALAENIGRVYCEKKQSGKDYIINIWTYSNSGEYITLCWCKLAENKRICAADFISAAAEKRAELLKDAEHMERILPTIETRRRQIDILSNQLNALLADLTYTEKELFNLNKRISRW